MVYTRQFQPQPLSIDDDGSRLKDQLLKMGAPQLQRLSLLREVGWKDESLDNHFQKQRHVADNSNDYMNAVWFKRMKGAFKELDSFASFVPSQGSFKFLDLGCCPGGFSSYVLAKNSDATGVGISLPVEQGGHVFLLEHPFRTRFTLHMADLLYYKLHQSPDDSAVDSRLYPLPSGMTRQFDLITLDGHQLRIYRGPELQDAEDWDRHRLFVSQFVIALRAVKVGGTMVVKMSHLEREGTASWLVFLDKISRSLSTRKPRGIHGNRGTFYVIAQGVGLGRDGQRLEDYQRCLEELWYEISFGGDEGKGRALRTEDLNFVVTHEELVSETSVVRLLELGRDPWTVQADALQRWFQRKGLL